MKLIAILGVCLGTTGCTGLPSKNLFLKNKPEPLLNLKPVKFDALPGWGGDAHAEALAVFLRSCSVIKKKNPKNYMGPYKRMGKIADWIDLCTAAEQVRPGNNVDAKYFFEKRFSVFLALNDKNHNGLFTGYYEPALNGSWSPSNQYKTPILSLPKNLISVDLGKFKKEWNGEKIIGRMHKNKLVPYYDRKDVENGVLKNKGLEILWVDDPIDAFFLHIQGSGRIILPDGSHIRIGYAGRNGHAYTSIGRVLVGMGELKTKDVNMPKLREWLRLNPIAGKAVMQKNRSFVFFRVIQEDSPIGAQNVPLTPTRSLAVDTAFVPLGIPVWVDTKDPLSSTTPLRRMFVSQDTGSAIKGPVRGDIFWGHGKRASKAAGFMNAKGRYFLLLPIEKH